MKTTLRTRALVVLGIYLFLGLPILLIGGVTTWLTQDALSPTFRYDEVQRLEAAQVTQQDWVEACVRGRLAEGRPGEYWIRVPLSELDTVFPQRDTRRPVKDPFHRSWTVPRTMVVARPCSKPPSPGRKLTILRRSGLPFPLGSPSDTEFDDRVRELVAADTLRQGIVEAKVASSEGGHLLSKTMIVYFDRARPIQGDHLVSFDTQPERTKAHPLITPATLLARVVDWATWPIHVIAWSNFRT